MLGLLVALSIPGLSVSRQELSEASVGDTLPVRYAAPLVYVDCKPV